MKERRSSAYRPQADVKGWPAHVAIGLPVLFALCALAAAQDGAPTSTEGCRRQIPLREGWLVKQLDSDHPDVIALAKESASPDKTWLPARMPAQVHDVLLAQVQAEVAVKAGEANRCLTATGLGEISLRSQFLQATFAGRDACCLLIAERYLHLPDAHLNVRRDHNRLEITTDKFARQVTLQWRASAALFSRTITLTWCLG